MLNLIHGDFFKARKTMGIKVLFSLICICACGVVITAYLFAEGTIGYDLSGQLALLSDVVMRGLIGALLASVLICGEFDNKVISNEISSGYSRDRIVIGKMISYFLFIAIILAPYCIATIVGVASGYHFIQPFTPTLFLTILSDASTSVVDTAFVGKMLCIMMLQILAYMSQLSLVVLIAFILKKGVASLVLRYMATVVFDLLSALSGKMGVIGKVIKLMPFSQGVGTLSMDCSGLAMLKSFLSSIIFAVIITIVTCFVFRKEDLK